MSKTELRPGQKIKMVSYDELCGGGEPKTDVIAGETLLDIDVIDDFENHPFKVLDDIKMDELVESISENGILSPVIVRSKLNGRYELISGHRRRHAAVRAGLSQIPAIVKELSDDEAIVLMVDANIQREEILPSERAKSLKMKRDAMDRQRANGINLGNKSRELLGEEIGISGRQVQRYINLNNLLPALLDMVDQKKIQLKLGESIAALRIDVQAWILEYLTIGGTINAEVVNKLRIRDEEEGLTADIADYILNEGNYKEKPRKITLNDSKLRLYFGSDYSKDDIEEIIYQLLDQWKWNQEGAVDDE